MYVCMYVCLNWNKIFKKDKVFDGMNSSKHRNFRD